MEKEKQSDTTKFTQLLAHNFFSAIFCWKLRKVVQYFYSFCNYPLLSTIRARCLPGTFCEKSIPPLFKTWMLIKVKVNIPSCHGFCQTLRSCLFLKTEGRRCRHPNHFPSYLQTDRWTDLKDSSSSQRVVGEPKKERKQSTCMPT